MQASNKNTGERISSPSSERIVKSQSPALDALYDYFRHQKIVLDGWLESNRIKQQELKKENN